MSKFKSTVQSMVSCIFFTIESAHLKYMVECRQSQSPYNVFLSGCCCSRGEDLVHQKLKYFHET